MKIEALPSVFFATLVIDLRICLAAVFLAALFVPTITYAKSKPRVAVVYFDNNSGDSKLDRLSKGFADMLITDLSSSRKVTVVEREKLQTLVDEAKLQQSSFFDPKTAVTIGKGLGASHVVAGAFMESSPKMRIDVRLIEIASGDVILTAHVKGKSDDIFELEQELVAKFLKNLDVKFSPSALPPTKVPNLKSLVSYSEALGLVDAGQDAMAAAQFQRVVRMAPAFALARIRHGEILKRIALAKTQRAGVLNQGGNTLYARARAAIASKKFKTLSEKDASHRLGYRVVLRQQASAALYAALIGRSTSSRLVPAKGSQKARQAMRAYYENQRLLLLEIGIFRERFPTSSLRFTLPKADQTLAIEMGIKYSDGDYPFTMLRFLLDGRVAASGTMKHFTMSPAPSDLDPKLKKAALSLAAAVIQNSLKLPKHEAALAPVRAYELLAKWHIGRERIEEGIAEYQKILDNFPSLKRWDFFEEQIHQQLGIKHQHLASLRRKYSLALKNCSANKINAAQTHVLSSRIRSRGSVALKEMQDEVAKACSTSPEYPRIQKALLRTLTSRAGYIDDCKLLNKFEAEWIRAGGSMRNAQRNRTKYICN